MKNIKILRLFATIAAAVLLLISGSMTFGIWLNKLETNLPPDKDLISYSAVIDSTNWVEYKNTAKQLLIKFSDSSNAARLGGYSLEASDLKSLNSLKQGDSVNIMYKEYKIRKGAVFHELYPWWQFKEIWSLTLFKKNKIETHSNDSLSSEYSFSPQFILKSQQARDKIIQINLDQAKILQPIWIAMLCLFIISAFFSIRFLNQKD
jgi:hypothetical protein